MKLKKRGTGVVAVPDAELPALTADQVRDALERARDKRYRTSDSVIRRLEKMLHRAKASAKTRR